MSKQFGYGILGLFGFICLAGSLTLLGLFNQIVQNKIKEQLQIKNGSDVYDNWKEVPFPLHITFRIFHVNNSYDVQFNGEKPQIIEYGPYVFEETKQKYDIHYSDDYKFVSYREHNNYTFIPHLSNGSLTDEVTVVNFPLLGIVSMAKSLPKKYSNITSTTVPLLISLLSAYLYTDKTNGINQNELNLFTTQTVGGLLFDGYHLELIEKVFKFAQMKAEKFGINMDIENPFPENKFGIFYKEPEPVYTVYTGIGDTDDLLKIYKYNNKSTFNNWNSAECNEIKGTDGTEFSPPISKDDILYSFQQQLCRSIYLDYLKETTVKGIDTYHFLVPDRLFNSPLTDPKNKCYCISDDQSKCLKGLIDVSNCDLSNGAPVILSAPYFNHGDPILRAAVGMDHIQLDEEKHGSYLDIEPMTGVPFKGFKRIQLNANIEKIEYFESLKYINDSGLIMPVLWVEENAEVDEKHVNEFKDLILNKINLAMGLIITAIVIGALLLIISVALCICHRTRMRKTQSSQGLTHHRKH